MNEFSVLLVDDEEDFLEILTKRLKKRGLYITTAKSGMEALAKLKETEIDIVVLDVRMPKMDGIQTLKDIKKIAPSVEVIMLTGHASLEVATKGLEIGAFDYLMKPMDIDELFYKLQDAYKKKCIEEQKKKDTENMLHSI